MKHQLQAKKPVIIIPIHLRSILLYHALSHNGVEVLGFWDNDSTLDGESYDGVGISLPVSADKFGNEVTIIICYNKYKDELRTQLESLGHSDIISAQMISVYKAKERLYSYSQAVNANDLIRIKPQYMNSGKLWLDTDRCLALIGMLPDEYYTVVMNALRQHNGSDFNNKCHKVLLVSCSMDYNGALVALKNAAITLQKNGDIPIVFSKYNGTFLHELLKLGIPVLIDQSFPEAINFPELAMNFDLVIVNSILVSNILAIKKLNYATIPVIWWLHEPIHCYEIAESFPMDIGENIHIYCVGKYAQNAFNLANIANGDTKTEILLYGVREEGINQNRALRMPVKLRLTIMIIGSIEERKGQDVLCEAIRSLDGSVRSKCEFVFIGKPIKQNCRVHSEMLSLKRDYPESVTLIDQLDRDSIFKAISQCDCMICSSRDDPMPIFMAEAMMYKKICICSENTGTAALIEHGENGFVYSKNDPEQLRHLIEYVVNNFANLQSVGEKGRRIFDKYFSYDVFERNFLNIVDEVCNSQRSIINGR